MPLLMVNGTEKEVSATRLNGVLEELGYAGKSVAVAMDGSFVPRGQYDETAVERGARLEILAPMQGG